MCRGVWLSVPRPGPQSATNGGENLHALIDASSIEGGSMEDVIIKIGLLRSWNTGRGFGFIDVPTTVFPLEKYFLHVSDILEGSNPPPVGSMVRFEVGPPRKVGKLPTARKAWIIAPKDVTSEAI
jgi:hypothetical protein